jgi:hypothetical protein
MAWAARLGIALNKRVHSADPLRYNIGVMFGILVWRTLKISLIANFRLLTHHGA